MAERSGVVLGPMSPLLQGTVRRGRLEDDEAALCDDLIARITGRSGVVNLSQRRASQLTVGLPDRRYRAHGFAFFWELKPEHGQLTASQHAFLLDELQHGALAACGTLEDLQVVVEVFRRARAGLPGLTPFSACEHLVARWAAKGYRREPQRRLRRRR